MVHESCELHLWWSFLELDSSCSLYVFVVWRKKQHEHSSKHFYLCSTEERNLYGFEMTQGCIIDNRILIFGSTNPLTASLFRYHFMCKCMTPPIFHVRSNTSLIHGPNSRKIQIQTDHLRYSNMYLKWSKGMQKRKGDGKTLCCSPDGQRQCHCAF